MQADLADYLPGTTVWHRMDSRWKLAGLLGAVVLVVSLTSLPAAGLALTAAFACLATAKLAWREWRDRVGGLAFLLALSLLLLPFTAAELDASLGPIPFSTRGLRLATLLVLKSLAVVSLILLLTATASLASILKAARQMGCPRPLATLALLTQRYLYLLNAEMGQYRIALRLRGYRSRPTLRTYRTIAQVTGTLLVRADDRATRVHQAMRCRGFTGEMPGLPDGATRASDVALFLVLVLVGGVPWLVEFLGT